MHPTLSIAMRAAREAGRVMLRNMDRLDRVKVDVKERNDFVSDVDREAEAEIIRAIQQTFPDHAILAEESGALGRNQNEWVIDPLDGTTNYLHGLPQFAVSIGFRHAGRMESAVVYNPLNEEMFTASRGSGAFLNDRRIRVSQCTGLGGALLGTGFPFRLPQHVDAYIETFRSLLHQCGDVRRAGAAALDFANVAAGRLDGFWEIGLAEWDMAAGTLLIQESGGLVGDFGGGHDHFATGNVVAGTPKVFKAIVQAIHPHLPPNLAR
jgi:myo-inositol-1(or 4)-monophosphatase